MSAVSIVFNMYSFLRIRCFNSWARLFVFPLCASSLRLLVVDVIGELFSSGHRRERGSAHGASAREVGLEEVSHSC